MKDPLDLHEPEPLSEQVEPYQQYGDDELAVALLGFSKKFGGPGIATPCVALADYHCQNCDEDVRGVSRPDGDVLECPICGEIPGMLTLGRGPNSSQEDSA